MSCHGGGRRGPYDDGVLRVRILSLLAVTLAASVGVSGCGSDDRPDAAPRPARATESATPTAAPTPAASSAADSASTTPSTAHSAPSSPGRHKVGALQPRTRAAAPTHLLEAAQLPAVADRAWTVSGTRPEDPVADPAVGACQKTPLGTIGAVEAVRRTFRAAAGQTATQVVARFADAKSAWRAHRVLVAWRDDCESRRSDATVGRLLPVTVVTGTASSYRASYGARPRASGLGILRTGAYLTVVEVTTAPESYPTSWDPVRVAVRRIARTFQT
jgi:hypothetical protein